MTETYTNTKKNAPRGVIRKLEREFIRLDIDDQLFYDFLKSKMDTLLQQPQTRSVNKITSYSKTWRTPVV